MSPSRPIIRFPPLARWSRSVTCMRSGRAAASTNRPTWACERTWSTTSASPPNSSSSRVTRKTHECRRESKAHQSEARQTVRPRYGQGPGAQGKEFLMKLNDELKEVLLRVREKLPPEKRAQFVRRIRERFTALQIDDLAGYTIAGALVGVVCQALPLDAIAPGAAVTGTAPAWLPAVGGAMPVAAGTIALWSGIGSAAGAVSDGVWAYARQKQRG